MSQTWLKLSFPGQRPKPSLLNSQFHFRGAMRESWPAYRKPERFFREERSGRTMTERPGPGAFPAYARAGGTFSVIVSCAVTCAGSGFPRS